jgi:hypothetical protein
MPDRFKNRRFHGTIEPGPESTTDAHGRSVPGED